MKVPGLVSAAQASWVSFSPSPGLREFISLLLGATCLLWLLEFAIKQKQLWELAPAEPADAFSEGTGKVLGRNWLHW